MEFVFPGLNKYVEKKMRKNSVVCPSIHLSIISSIPAEESANTVLFFIINFWKLWNVILEKY